MRKRSALFVVCIFMIAAFTWSAGNEFNISIEKTPDLVIDAESSEFVYFINLGQEINNRPHRSLSCQKHTRPFQRPIQAGHWHRNPDPNSPIAGW